MRFWGIAALAVAVSGCSGVVPRHVEHGTSAPPAQHAPSRTEPAYAPEPQAHVAVRQPTPATPRAPIAASPAPVNATTAVAAGLVAGPSIDALPISDQNAARTLSAFRTSCASLQRRTDASGLTRGADWTPACNAAASASDRDARGFFNRWFETVQVADGKAHATGYYEPEIAGSRQRRRGYEVPIYGKPADLVEIDLGKFSKDYQGKRIRGRMSGQSFVPYFERKEIEQGALQDRAPIIAYAADPVEIFFLQIQGSGRLRQPDGSIIRIGYASQNGRDYTAIGALMRERGLLKPGGASMQGIMAYLRENPAAGREIMWENKSFIFFHELTGPGPLGSMGLPVTREASVAVDPRFIPMGGLVFLSMDRSDANGLWVAQDTGGAIKGTNRVDTFWGAGEDARAIAGGMNAKGTAWLLVPRGTLARHKKGS